MIEKINNDLNNVMTEANIIYVLKGFNNIIKRLNFKIKHIFDLNIIDDLINIFEVDNKSILANMLEILSSGESCYCLFEELLYIDKNNLMGVVFTYDNYKIKIIDIGCFEYHYPGLICNYIEETIKKFDSDEIEANILQKIYTEYSTINGVPFISYNILENCNKYEVVKLYNMFSGDYIHYNYDEIKCFELLDNSPTEKFIEVFYEALYGMINTINYTIVEKKDNIFVSKLLYVMNELGINIIVVKNKKNYDLPDNYDDYVSILKRIDQSYEFKEFQIYNDPFSSNDKIMINQSVIIDTIYKNIKNANMHMSFRDIFVTAPTGAGKSVLFQIPAIMAAEKLNLVTIVISPLIGLMNDQVKNIEKLTNCAATINSDYTPYEKEVIKQKIKNNEISILYISPETLLSNYDIENLIGDRTVGMIVVDEAHTVATWGKNFRPDYWYLGEYIDRLRHRQKRLFPIATFTATATISNGLNDMYHDIIESLNMTCDPFFGDVKRSNIEFEINLCKKDHAYKEEKDEKVVKRINEFVQSGEKSLIYFPFVKNLEEIYDMVPKEKVGKYFGGMDKNAKDICLEEFRTNEKNVVLATKAFGMGIDVKSIKNVYHFAPTGNLADYVQEIGRAARSDNETGLAITDFYEEDFRYINVLYGLSQINDYHIREVLKKILFKYRVENSRNFMISPEDFSHIFSAEKDEDIDSKLKATIIAIKRDFKYKTNYVPLIFKPRTMFTKGFFYIPDAKMIEVKAYGWEKYLTEKYSGEQLTLLDAKDIKTSYLGKVYEFDFKKCWSENFNGLYDGITFGTFKRNFYLNELKGYDRSFMKDRLLLSVDSKNDNDFKTINRIANTKLNILKSILDDLKMSNKQKTIEEIANMYIDRDQYVNKTLMKGVMDPLLNLLIDFTTTNNSNVDKFCDFNSRTGRYHIKSSNYIRKINQLQKAIDNFFTGFENLKKRIAIVDNSSNVSRTNPIVVAVQIMELFDLVSYTFTAGEKPEYFVRVNSASELERIVNNPSYHSATLRGITQMHYDSINYMTYFFKNLKTNEQRWNFIEDYFLGRVEEKYNVPRISKTNVKSIDNSIDDNPIINEVPNYNIINIYTLYNDVDNESFKYYISDKEIEKLEELGFSKLSPDCPVAKEMYGKSMGDVFNINDYEYLIDKIDKFDLEQ